MQSITLLGGRARVHPSDYGCVVVGALLELLLLIAHAPQNLLPRE
jgi:hypothetical protein